MATSSARPDDLDDVARGSRAADDELRTLAGRHRAAYAEFRAGTRWGHFDADSLIDAFGRYIDLNEIDARWVAQIARAFRAAGGDGDLARLPDAAIAASLKAAGLTGERGSVTFDSPLALGFPPTSGYADDPVNTASGNFLLAETDLPTLTRVYNSRSGRAGAFGPGWLGSVGGGDPWGSAPPGGGPAIGFRGELEFGALSWLRDRVYDPGTRAFLSPDPLPPLPGTPFAANPYHFAGNDPIGWADPLGLRPVTDAEVRRYRDQMGQDVWSKGGGLGRRQLGVHRGRRADRRRDRGDGDRGGRAARGRDDRRGAAERGRQHGGAEVHQ